MKPSELEPEVSQILNSPTSPVNNSPETLQIYSVWQQLLQQLGDYYPELVPDPSYGWHRE